jgi:hypothetical protein
MNTLLYVVSIFIFMFIESIIHKYNKIIAIYKNPIFKLIFIFGIYIYGEKDIILTLLFAMFYIYLGQKIQENELNKLFT